MKVTILGAGGMGCAMAARLLDTGHQVMIWDRAREGPLGPAAAPSRWH